MTIISRSAAAGAPSAGRAPAPGQDSPSCPGPDPETAAWDRYGNYMTGAWWNRIPPAGVIVDDDIWCGFAEYLRNTTPAGDRREHAVACRRCQRLTWAVNAVCDRCTTNQKGNP